MGSTSCVSKQFWSMDRYCLSIKIFVNVFIVSFFAMVRDG